MTWGVLLLPKWVGRTDTQGSELTLLSYGSLQSLQILINFSDIKIDKCFQYFPCFFSQSRESPYLKSSLYYCSNCCWHVTTVLFWFQLDVIKKCLHKAKTYNFNEVWSEDNLFQPETALLLWLSLNAHNPVKSCVPVVSRASISKCPSGSLRIQTDVLSVSFT